MTTVWNIVLVGIFALTCYALVAEYKHHHTALKAMLSTNDALSDFVISRFAEERYLAVKLALEYQLRRMNEATKEELLASISYCYNQMLEAETINPPKAVLEAVQDDETT